MDSLETLSNLSERSNPEDESSNLSSLSTVTGFEEDICYLKLPMPYSASSNSKNHPQSVKSNISESKSELLSIERKLETKYRNQIADLIRSKSDLERQLVIAKCTSNGAAHSNLQDISFINEQNYLLENDLSVWKNRFKEVNEIKKKLENEAKESKIELNFKNTCITDLKTKITDLYVELENKNQKDITLSSECCLLQSQVDSLKKSDRWYKDQLHTNRIHQSALCKEIFELKQDVIGRNANIEKLNREIGDLKNNFQLVQVNFNREKDELIENLKHKGEENRSYTLEPDNNITDYEITIESLTQELKTIKNGLIQHETLYTNIAKRNSELEKLNAILEEQLNEKEFFLNRLNGQELDLKADIQRLEEKNNERDVTIGILQNQKMHMQIEKENTEKLVTAIREDLNKIAISYKKLKGELEEKNKLVSDYEMQKRQITVLKSGIKETVSLYENWKEQKYLENITNVLLSLLKLLNSRDATNSDLTANLTVFQENIERVACQLQNEQVIDVEEEKFDSGSGEDDEKIKSLKALCEAKDFNTKQLQKRFEANNRTLISQVTEQLKEKRSMEKRINNLDNLFKSNSREIDKLQMELCCKDEEILKLKEKMVFEVNNCEKNLNLKKRLDESQIRIKHCSEQLKKNNFMVNHLHEKITNLTAENYDMRIQVEDHIMAMNKTEKLLTYKDDLIKNYEKTSEKSVAIVEEIKSELTCRVNENRCLKLQLLDSEQYCNQLKENIYDLKEEINVSSTTLASLNEELSHVEKQKENEESKVKLHSLIQEMEVLSRDLEQEKRDKRFLQRLCNDLKFALHSSANLVQNLKKQIADTKKGCALFENTKYSGDYIEKLLRKNESLKVNPLGNLENNLVSLKKEVTTLHNQVIRKLHTGSNLE